MAFEDIKVRGLTFAERGELIKSGFRPIVYPSSGRSTIQNAYYVLVSLRNGLCNTSTALTEDEINAAPDNDLMEVALFDTMRFTHEKKRLKN